MTGIPVLFRGLSTRDCTSHLPFQLKETFGPNTTIPFFTRSISSKASEQPGQTGSKKQPGRSGSEVWVWTEILELNRCLHFADGLHTDSQIAFVFASHHDLFPLSNLWVSYEQ